MEQNKFSYSPYSVKRALENTAQFMEHMDPFAQGAGLLQVTLIEILLTENIQ